MTKRTTMGIFILLVITVIFHANFGSSESILAINSKVVTESLPLRAASGNFPTNGWRTADPESQGLDSIKLNRMYGSINELDIGVDSIAIVRNGFLVYEKSFAYYDYSQIHHLYSSTKSITSILIGIANSTGYITNLDQPVLEIFTDRNFANLDTRKQQITIRHLLKMESGLEWNEDPLTNDTVDKHDYPLLSNHTNYFFEGWPICMESKAVRMILLSEDWVQFALDQPMVAEPGTRFEYSTGVSHLLSAILQKKTGRNMTDFAKQFLFDPLNITNYYWWSDPMGITTGGFGLWLTPLDMAKIGYLCLNNGTWNNQQIVPKEWVQESLEPYNLGLMMNGMEWWYGYQWWVDPITNFRTTGGFGGQFIFVKSDADLVVAITASEHGTEDSVAALYYDYILESIVTETTASTQKGTGFTGMEILFVVVLLAMVGRRIRLLRRSN